MTNVTVLNDVEDEQADEAPSHGALVVLDEARTRLASITTMEAATQWRSQLVGVQHYLKSRRAGLAMQNKAALFKFQIERRIGELLLAVPKAQGKRDEADGLLLTIKRSGHTTWAAYRWMALAKTPETELLRAAESCDQDGEELTSTLIYEVLVRRWQSRHADAGVTDQPTEAGAEGLSLAQAKRELEELELLAPGALVGLSDLEARMIIFELRKAYELYCEDEARGKAPSWGDELPDSLTVQAKWAAGPFTWKTKKGWYPAYTVNRQYLRHLTEKVIADLSAGIGDGHRGIARQFALADRLKGYGSSHGPHDPLSRLLPFIEEIRKSLHRDVENFCSTRQVVIDATVHLAIQRLEWLREETEAAIPSHAKDGSRFVPHRASGQSIG